MTTKVLITIFDEDKVHMLKMEDCYVTLKAESDSDDLNVSGKISKHEIFKSVASND